MIFAFEALDARGVSVRGRREAPDAESLRWALEREGLIPVSLRQSLWPSGLSIGLGQGRLGEQQAGQLVCDLARYVKGGLSVPQSLTLLSNGGRPAVRLFAGRVRDRVMVGEPLSVAFAEAGGHMGRLLGSLAAAGELSGRQAEILEAGGMGIIANAALKRRMLTLSLYPLFVLAVALVAVLIYAYDVLPTLEPALLGMGAGIPPQTRLVVTAGRLLRQAVPIVFVLTMAIAIGLAMSGRLRELAREALGRVALSRLGGGLLNDMIFAGVADRVAVTLQAGSPLLAAWRAAIGPIGFSHVRRRLEAQSDRLRDGLPLSQALIDCGLAPDDLIRMTQVGESADDLPRILKESSRLMGGRAQETAERLLGAAVPLVVVIIGGLVGSITLVVFQGLMAVTSAVDV
jgi:type II secretory pathway component PulF